MDRLILRELAREYSSHNIAHFERSMRMPQLSLSDEQRLGSYHHARGIAIDRSLVAEQPWGVVVEVLRHEMAHQYVHEVLCVTDEPAHGPTFQALCERLGIDAGAKGLPRAAGEDNPVVSRVQKLLRLATSDNEHEAQSAAAAAQKLMLRHNIDSVGSEGRALSYRVLGSCTRRTLAEARLSQILSEHFFVHCIWTHAIDATGKRSVELEVMGDLASLQVAEYAYAFLRRSADDLWRAFRAQTGARGSERQRFTAGVYRGFAEKLDEQQAANAKAGLVKVPHADVEAYVAKRFPRRRKVTNRGHADLHLSAAAGRAAGGKLTLHVPVGSGGASSNGKLLGS